MSGGALDFYALPLDQFVLIAVVAFFSAILGGISAFGTGLLITPFLVPILGIKAVVPVMSVAMIFGNLARAGANRHDIDLRLTAKIMMPAVPGIMLGTLIYDSLSPRFLSFLIGGFLLVSVPLRRAIAGKLLPGNDAAILPTAAIFGLVSGAVPGGGVIIMPILLSIGLTGGAIIGTDGLIGAGVNIIKIALFGHLDLLDLTLLIAGCLIGICTIPGAFAARMIVNRLNIRVHTAIIETIVLLSGLWLIRNGLQY